MVEAVFAAADGFGEKDVAACPDDDVDHQQHRRVEEGGDKDVDADKGYRGQQDGQKGLCLRHSEGKELMMDVAFVGKEGIATVSHTVEIDAEYVEAGDYVG